MDQSNQKRITAGPTANLAGETADAGDDVTIPTISGQQTEEDGTEELDRLLKWFDEETRSGSMSVSGYLTDSVTINGDEEMCGSSFSGAAATVMAGVDTKNAAGLPYFCGSDSPPPEIVRAAAEERIARGVKK